MGGFQNLGPVAARSLVTQLIPSSDIAVKGFHAKVSSHEASLAGGAGDHSILLAAHLTDFVPLQTLHNSIGREQLLQTNRAL